MRAAAACTGIAGIIGVLFPVANASPHPLPLLTKVRICARLRQKNIGSEADTILSDEQAPAYDMIVLPDPGS